MWCRRQISTQIVRQLCCHGLNTNNMYGICLSMTSVLTLVSCVLNCRPYWSHVRRIHRLTENSPYKETVIWRHDVFFSINLTKLWNKQWFETTPRPCDMAVPGMHQQIPSESCCLSNCWTLRLLQHIYFIFILCASHCLKVAWKYICFWYRFLTIRTHRESEWT